MDNVMDESTQMMDECTETDDYCDRPACRSRLNEKNKNKRIYR